VRERLNRAVSKIVEP